MSEMGSMTQVGANRPAPKSPNTERVVSFLTAHLLQTARRETAGSDEPIDISAKPASRWCLLRGRFNRIF